MESRFGTLSANVVTTVTLTGRHQRVEVMNRDNTAEIFFTTDTSTPTVAGNDTYCLPATACSIETDGATEASATTVVKLVSDGAARYGVIAK